MLDKTYSYSQINTYKSCPEKYKFLYLDKIRKPDESIETFMGNRVHEVVEWVFRDRLKKFTAFDKLVLKYDEFWLDSWHDKIFIADPRITIDHIYTIGLRCLGNFSTTYGPIFNFPVYATELKLDFEVEGYKFRGILDRVDRIDDNQIMVVDYKTSKRAKGLKAAKSDIQLGLYFIAIKQHFKSSVDISVGWDFLRHNKRIQVKPLEDSIKRTQKHVVKKIKEIENNIEKKYTFFPKESILCHWCYYWKECSVKNQLNPARLAK